MLSFAVDVVLPDLGKYLVVCVGGKTQNTLSHSCSLSLSLPLHNSFKRGEFFSIALLPLVALPTCPLIYYYFFNFLFFTFPYRGHFKMSLPEISCLLNNLKI